jgi:FKBP-type peptidyl-prolyl cis-trans isomerase
MTKKLFTIVSLIALLLVTGCNKETDDTLKIENEERYFQLYMTANYPDLEPTANGLYFIEYEEGSGATPDEDDYVLINYLAYTVPGEEVVDTYTEEWAREYNLYLSGVMYGPYKFRHGSEIAGMKEGLAMMKEGGVARLIFKSDLGYGGLGFGSIDDYESLMYDIELIEVIDDVYAREQEQIDAYLAEQTTYEEIYDEETDATLYYIPTEVGDSSQVENKDEVEILYKGELLDGRVFDSNLGSASGFKVKIGKEEVIRGWELGLLKFRYGGKGKLLIPHELAYGEEGSLASGSSKVSIPPVEALLFEIEVVKSSGD